MKLLRTLFVASGVLTLSAATLSAQAAQQVTCKDGVKVAAARAACATHGGLPVAAKADAKVAKTEMKADAKVEKTAAKTEKAAGETKVAKKHTKHSKKAKA